MKQYTNAMRKISSVILPVLFLLMANTSFAGDYAAGEKLFKANCASCHNMEKKMTGPALMGVCERVPDLDWLKAWIKANSELRASGDAYANKVFNDNGGALMTDFAWMSDQELDDISTYLCEYAPKTDDASAGAGSGKIPCDTEQVEEESNIVVWLGVIVLALLVIAIFTGINRSLKNAKAIKEGGEEAEPMSFLEAIKDFSMNHKIQFGLMVIAVVGALATMGWNFAMQVGVYGGNGFEKTENIENYKPEQPIAFRHDIHVKQNKIDCKYCHSGVLESRHALIPSANVCMNCHKAVNEGHCSGTEEIQKIYDATGWDPEKGKYLHADGNYYDVPREDKPIQWVKVHNLPDFAYFNHSQHVVVGGLECEQCHGDVENMTVAEHHAPLTMGWCVNCHRETAINTELKFEGKSNGYYEKMHEEFKEAWKHEAEFDFTVEKIGGLECAKCHY